MANPGTAATLRTSVNKAETNRLFRSIAITPFENESAKTDLQSNFGPHPVQNQTLGAARASAQMKFDCHCRNNIYFLAVHVRRFAAPQLYSRNGCVHQ